jgi:hypothetical protein
MPYCVRDFGVFLPWQCEAICRIYDNRKTIGFGRREDPAGHPRDAAPRITEELTVPLGHHAGVGMAKTARDCERIFSRLR